MIPGVGPVLRRRLLDRFGSPQAVFEASLEDLRRVEGVGERTAKAIKAIDPISLGRREGERARAMGIGVIPLGDDRYPENLRQIYDPPIVLYLKGDLCPEDSLAVAVVGSRRSSPYGRQFARRLARALASEGVTVVSGMARGIDTEAHLGALEAEGRTIAVLGSGMDRIYPPENRQLASQIAHHGAVLTEFPLGTPPERWNFPVRNRIISGLSLGVVVVEASSRSGALITASLALEQGRSVFAVPGYAGAVTSRGTHSLIRQGAKLVEDPEDVLEEILPQYEGKGETEKAGAPEVSKEERMLVELLETGPMHIDELSRRVSLDAAKVSALLTQMEIKGIVLQMPGKVFTLVR